MADNPEKTLVSVIIPTFNRRGSLPEAVDSVLAQDYPHFELLVVDDGSTDGTADALSAYGDRLKLLRQPNRGVSAARNAGVRRSSGELIAFLDSDDFWRPRKIGRQVDFFRTHPRALICQCGEIWVRNGTRVNPGRRHRKRDGMIFEPSLELCLVSPSAVMLRRGLLETVGGFDESLPACEDYDLWLRIGCRWPIHLLPEADVVKRGGHADQLSRASGLDRFRIASLLKIMASGDLSAAQCAAAEGVLKKKCRIYAQGCRRRGRQAEAEYYFDLSNGEVERNGGEGFKKFPFENEG